MTSYFIPATPQLYRPGFGFWLMVLVMGSLTLIGGVGVILAALRVGTSAERRSALAKRATDIDLLNEALPSRREYPTIPRDTNLTNSPGIRLAYRLPVTHGGVWALFAATAFFLVWNAVAAVIVTVDLKNHMAGRHDWSLTLLAIPMVLVGVWSGYYFIQQMMLHTGIGPTSVEISDHPLRPGQSCQVSVWQSGRLVVNSLTLSLVCEEETTFRQGTDIRTERSRVFCGQVFCAQDFKIEPGNPFERECPLNIPAQVMHSFKSSHNAVYWMLTVRGDTKFWAIFERKFPIVVYPPSFRQRVD